MKKVSVASVSSTEAFPTVGLTLEVLHLRVEVPMGPANIFGSRVREECWYSGLDARPEAVVTSIHLKVVAANIQLEAMVAATSMSAQLCETLPMASRVLDRYENPVT
jgi:hypothetical protein